MANRIMLPHHRKIGGRWGMMASATFLLASAPARAEDHAAADEPSVTLAFVTGAAIAGASLGVGGAIAVGGESDAVKSAGIYTAQAGLVASPFIAHVVLGEYKRGVLFSILPVGAMLGMAAILQSRPHTVAGGPATYQYAFTMAMTLSVFSSMLGVSDVLSFHDRNGENSIAVLPDVSQERIGIHIGGKL
jgi:fructose-specific component phosphotransferase system IIB-like protein